VISHYREEYYCLNESHNSAFHWKYAETFDVALELFAGKRFYANCIFGFKVGHWSGNGFR